MQKSMKAWKNTPKPYDLNSEMSYGINSGSSLFRVENSSNRRSRRVGEDSACHGAPPDRRPAPGILDSRYKGGSGGAGPMASDPAAGPRTTRSVQLPSTRNSEAPQFGRQHQIEKDKVELIFAFESTNETKPFPPLRSLAVRIKLHIKFGGSAKNISLSMFNLLSVNIQV